MDLATLSGILLALASLIGAFVLDGGKITALLQPTAAMIVFGGTIGATLASVGIRDVMTMIKGLKIAFLHKPQDPLSVIDRIVEFAVVARREGLLALEDLVEQDPDEFLKSGMRMVVDGVDPEQVRSRLEIELQYMETRHEAGARCFEAAGGFAPTMGIIGTVMGLVHVLGNLKSIDTLGPQIATAFTATLYGVASANILWLPIANKLKRRSAEEVLLREIMAEGILSVQAGENPNLLRDKLRAFLASSARDKRQAEKAGEQDAQTAQVQG
ncbi:MAG: flagellar motor protein [Thermoflavifilum sp.]|nr:flagellar motor protein [Thermoflavifilum sp.]MCL6514153.1 flagellar motor protein [Alicyclobacillus sp.]